MITATFQGVWRRVAKTFRSAIRGLIVNAALAAVGGCIYGTVFGVFVTLLRHEAWTIVWVGIYFGLCGAAAGAVVGVSCEMFDVDVFAREKSRASNSLRETRNTTFGAREGRQSPLATGRLFDPAIS